MRRRGTRKKRTRNRKTTEVKATLPAHLRASQPHHAIEDVPLVDVDGDEGLVLRPLHRFQVAGRLVDEQVEQVEETVVHLRHYSAIGACLRQGHFRVTGPDHLKAQDADLARTRGRFKAGILPGGGSTVGVNC